MYELLRKIEDTFLKEIIKVSDFFNYIDLNDDIELTPIIAERFYDLIRLFKNKKEYMLPLLSPHANTYFRNRFKKIVMDEIQNSLTFSGVSLGAKQKYIVIYLSSGIVESIYDWLKSQDLSVEEISALLFKMLSALTQFREKPKRAAYRPVS